MGLKDAILAAGDATFEDVDVPEWGVKVRIRSMSGTARDAYEAKAVALRRQGTDVEFRLANFRSRLLVQCLYDPETDERIFTDGEVDKLGGKSGQVIERLFTIAQRISGMGPDALEAARGNSESAESGGSTTG